MVKIKLNLSEANASVTGCQKCGAMGFTDRHHTAHAKMFIGFFQNRGGGDWSRYHDLYNRYHEFHPDDIVRICRDCHEEIHKIYRKLANKHRRSLGPGRRWKKFNRYTWAEADHLMQLFTDTCALWLSLKEGEYLDV